MKRFTFITITLALTLLLQCSCKRQYSREEFIGTFTDYNAQEIKEEFSTYSILEFYEDGTVHIRSYGHFLKPEIELYYEVHGEWTVDGDSIQTIIGPNEIKSDRVFPIDDKPEHYSIAIKTLKEEYKFTPEGKGKKKL